MQRTVQQKNESAKAWEKETRKKKRNKYVRIQHQNRVNIRSKICMFESVGKREEKKKRQHWQKRTTPTKAGKKWRVKKITKENVCMYTFWMTKKLNTHTMYRFSAWNVYSHVCGANKYICTVIFFRVSISFVSSREFQFFCFVLFCFDVKFYAVFQKWVCVGSLCVSFFAFLWAKVDGNRCRLKG